VFLSVGITCATLLILRRNAQAQVQSGIERDLRNAVLTLQGILRQQQSLLSRKADLLASLAYLRNGDATAITDASEDPWQSEHCNLFVLADKFGSIVAMHSATPSFSATSAQVMVSRSIHRGETSAWWFTGKALYQVALQPFYDGAPAQNSLLGTVVVGRLVNEKTAADLGRIASSDIVFRHDGQVAASTLGLLKEKELARQIHERFQSSQVFVADERYYANSLDLLPAPQSGTDLLVLKSYSQADADLRRLSHLLFAVGLVATFLGGTLIFLISDTVTRPLASLVDGVYALEHGDFTFPLRANGQDELSDLTRAFASMRATLQKNESQREQLEGQLRQAQKMEALGRLAGGVAHDFNNLLTVIRGHSELILDRLRPEDAVYRNSQQIQKTADRAASLTRQMLAFSRMQVLQPKIVNVNELIAEMGKLLRRLIREDIEFNLRLSDSLASVKADPGQLEQVLLNLTVNASDAMPTGGKLAIETQNIIVDNDLAQTRPSLLPGPYVVLSVSDTGHGMDPATKARIFEPFFTTKEPGRGTGLGLATVYGIVQQSGGFIWVESSPGNGSKFEIYLPQTSERPESFQLLTQAHQTASRRRTVLVVEDEKDVRELACEFLKAAGYCVFTSEDGLQALETAKQLDKSLDAVLTDIVMPRMRGQALATQLKTLLPHVKIIYMTGYLDQNQGSDILLQDAFFLHKPFTRATLVSQVAEAVKNDRPAKRPDQPFLVLDTANLPPV
jgi:signal transduction histidine kinase/ActR/RegA family two-component response regulator